MSTAHRVHPPVHRRRTTALAAILALAVVVAVVVVIVRRGPGPDAFCYRVAVPAYANPEDGDYWQAIRSAGAHVSYTIVNPDNGPGRTLQAGYPELLRSLRQAGQRVLGYVPTGYGHRDVHAVLADVARYRDWYGVHDIFLDEAAESAGAVATYREFVQAAHATGGMAVLNPGVVPDQPYFEIADAVVTFEGDLTQLRGTQPPRSLDQAQLQRSWAFVLGVDPPHLAEALKRVRAFATAALFVTDAHPPQPWASVPSYWETLTRAGPERCASARPAYGSWPDATITPKALTRTG